MAESSNPKTGALRLSKDTQDSLVQYAKIVLDLHQRMSEYKDKMEQIDISYARYKADSARNPGDDTTSYANQPCGVNINDITVPIVVSQVDAYVGYFTDVFLSGFPIFPVVTTYDNREAGEKLESIIDDHSIRGRYPRHLMRSFRDNAKYNISCIEVDWCPLDIYNVTDALTQLQGKGNQNRLERSAFYHNAIHAMDMYNTIWDYRVHPVDVPYIGEYAGYLDIVSRVQLKRDLAYYASSGDGYHTSQALATGTFGKIGTSDATGFGYYRERPQISDVVSNNNIWRNGMVDWMAYLSNKKENSRISRMSDVYERFTLYARIIPAEHSMNVPQDGTPQVWKLVFVNHEKLVYAKRIYSLYDMIPMFFSQAFEDGFGMQTKSLAENSMPFQKAASDLFSIRLNAARRALVDRAIYDPTMLNSSDVNAPYPAPKIPLRDGTTLSGKKLSDAYIPIPFDSRGTETVVQDMGQIIGMADLMNGTNPAVQGQHIKGNKTRKQWDDTQEGAKNKMRLPALAIEYQQMVPIKEQLKLNIYQYGIEGTFQDMTNGSTYQIDRAVLEDIRQKVGMFKLADGYHPAEKLASTDVLMEGMGMLSQSPILQQQLGIMLPNMFVHFMSLGGVKGLEQYIPKQMRQGAGGTAPPQSGQQGAPATGQQTNGQPGGGTGGV